MGKFGRSSLALLLSIPLVTPLGASGQVVFNYSTDIASDLDLSDPITPSNNISDCGDLYMEPFGPPVVIVNDDPAGPNPGYPLAGMVPAPSGIPAGQPVFAPPPAFPAFHVGGGSGVALPAAVRAEYNDAFDVDASDLLDWVVPPHPAIPVMLTGLTRNDQIARGIHFEPQIFISIDDDHPPGWFQTPINLPTTSGPDMGSTSTVDEVIFVGWFTNLTTFLPIGVRDEDMLGLAPSPVSGDSTKDDDVDALDANSELFPYWYWSADHEGNYSGYALAPAPKYDPGGIYRTDLSAAGPNDVMILDDVANLGLPMDTDVDAFEFISISQTSFTNLFGYDPDGGGVIGDDVLIGIFSVDDDDPDNDPLPADDYHGLEPGGLSPGIIYASDLVGSAPVPISPDYGLDIDALAAWREWDPDTDDDGMDDAWEIYYFGSITNSSGTNDYDLDTFIDIDEFNANTIPTNDLSFLGITNTLISGASNYVVHWMSASGITYSVEQTTNILDSASWVVDETNISATIPANVHTGALINNGNPWFIRIKTD